ncbi:unnamed protein product [Psylliodes chrysocephalus]|uniref:Uncharacterized protein n=1 Tax=Psylliodes chrysocephalus TaxID=3402493 RepID=A0A9P0CZC3_9CUCU|nr:unnamed protein product [Psylliodes chrysocephala]
MWRIIYRWLVNSFQKFVSYSLYLTGFSISKYLKMTGLTKDQEAFLEECNLEFFERFTDSDLEFKRVFDSEIPPPPIVTPWYGKQRFNNRDRDRPGGSYNNFRNYGREDREEQSSNYYGDRDRGYHNKERHFRPY